jgi:hypothetical protein
MCKWRVTRRAAGSKACPAGDGRSGRFAGAMKYRFLTLSLSVLTLFGSVVTGRAQDAGAPHLAKRGEVTQLIVDGKTYPILGAEIHNSGSSSLEYMEPSGRA